MARPTKYTPELLEAAHAYVDGMWEENGPVPSVVGLVNAIGISKSIAYDWAKHEDKKAFSDILTRVEALQEEKLIAGGLSGGFNPAFAKMMMTKHGYSDKVEQAHTSPDRSMSPQAPSEVTSDVVKALVDKLVD